MSDSLFGGLVPSSEHENLIFETLMKNPEFYDHKLGRCLCHLCDCGKCERKCKEISSKINKPRGP